MVGVAVRRGGYVDAVIRLHQFPGVVACVLIPRVDGIGHAGVCPNQHIPKHIGFYPLHRNGLHQETGGLIGIQLHAAYVSAFHIGLAQGNLGKDGAEIRQVGVAHLVGHSGPVKDALQPEIIGGAAGQVQSAGILCRPRFGGEGDDSLAVLLRHGGVAIVDQPIRRCRRVGRGAFRGLHRLAGSGAHIEANMLFQHIGKFFLLLRPLVY